MANRKTTNSAIASRRQKQIEDCLYRCLLDTPYQSVSVVDICRQVGISRKAFYNYYPDKEACLNAMIDRFLQDALLHAAVSIPDNATSLEAAIITLEYWKGKREFFDIILRDNLLHYLFQRNMNFVLREDRSTLDQLSTPDMDSDTDILACYMSSQLTLLLCWYLRGFDTPTPVIARKLLRILHFPMITPPAEI